MEEVARLMTEQLEALREGDLVSHYEAGTLRQTRRDLRASRRSVEQTHLYLAALADRLGEARRAMTELANCIVVKLKEEFKPMRPEDMPMTKAENQAIERSAEAHKSYARCSEQLSKVAQYTAEVEEEASKLGAQAARAGKIAGELEDDEDGAERQGEELGEDGQKRRKTKKEEAARKAEEERIHAEEERQREEEEEQRRKEEAERRKREEEEKRKRNQHAHVTWDPVAYDAAENDYNKSVGCIVRAKPGTFDKGTMSLEIKDPLACPPGLDDTEELVSDIFVLKSSDEEVTFQEAIWIAFPHCFPKGNIYREAAVKAQGPNGKWALLESNTTVIEEYKDVRLAEAPVGRLSSQAFAVVTRPRMDKETVNNRGVKIHSTADPRVLVVIPKNAYRFSTPVTVQVQPVDTATLNDLKLRHDGCEALFTTSPILTCSLPNFQKSITFTLPAPPGFAKKSKTGRRDSKKGVHDSKPEEEDDMVNLMVQQKGGRWLHAFDIAFIFKHDSCVFDLDEPYHRMVILRTKKDLIGKELTKIATELDLCLQERVINILLRQGDEDPGQVIIDCARTDRKDKLLRQMTDDGYSDGPRPSIDLVVREGQPLKISFRGNVDFEEGQSIKLLYNTCMPTSRKKFGVLEVDKFAQHGLNFYRGHAQFFTRPEEVKTPGKKDVKKKEQKEQKETPEDGVEEEEEEDLSRFLCELAVALPKPVFEHPHVTKVPPKVQLRAPIDDETVDFLGENLGDEWRQVADYLGVKKPRVQGILQQNFETEAKEVAIRDMLIQWYKHSSKSDDKFAILQESLVHGGRKDLADDLVERHKDYVQGEHKKTEEKRMKKAFQIVLKDQKAVEEWQRLAKKFHLAETDIVDIEHNNKGNIRDMCKETLSRWKNANEEEADVRHLAKTLRLCKLTQSAGMVEKIH